MVIFIKNQIYILDNYSHIYLEDADDDREIKEVKAEAVVKEQPKAEPKPKEVKEVAPAKEQEVMVKEDNEKGFYGNDLKTLESKLSEYSADENKGVFYDNGGSSGFWRHIVNINSIPLFTEGSVKNEPSYVVDFIYTDPKEAKSDAKKYNGKEEEVYYGEENQRFIRFKNEKDALKFILDKSKSKEVETQKPILSETTASENKTEKVTPVNQGGKTIIDENGDLTQELGNATN